MRRLLVPTALVGLAGAVGWWGMQHVRSMPPAPEGPGPAAEAPEAPHVEVVRPTRGGIERTVTQPGSVHAFETVELYAMVSGYLKGQEVDIGARVHTGQVLAEIDVPRERQAVVEAEALLEQARSQSEQAEATVKVMEAERATAAAEVDRVRADVDRLVADVKLAESQYARLRDLHGRNAVEQRLVDEQRRNLEAAAAAEKTARLAIQSAEAQLEAAVAQVEQAGADVAAARAAVGVAESRLARARVDLDYARIVAPFDGVVTRRNYHPGAFIHAASAGGRAPLLTVSRTDLMRVVVRIPDRDVVLTDPGDPATVTIDGLGGEEFAGEVARIAEAEDPATRTMRVEIDLPNPDGLLREGMYGRARILLEPPSDRLTIPSACVLERTGTGRGVVRVVDGGKVRRVDVELGADDGARVEVTTGLGPDDTVILRSSTPLDEGEAVVARASG